MIMIMIIKKKRSRNLGLARLTSRPSAKAPFSRLRANCSKMFSTNDLPGAGFLGGRLIPRNFTSRPHEFGPGLAKQA